MAVLKYKMEDGLTMECSTCYDYYEYCARGECLHKELFQMNGSEIGGTLAFYIGLTLCAAGGMGGGPVTLPVLILLYNFRVDEGAPLANFLISLGLFARYLFNARKKHPADMSRVRVDYTSVLVALPPSFLGSYLGIIVNFSIAPGISFCIIALTFLTGTVLIFKKAIQTCKS